MITSSHNPKIQLVRSLLSRKQDRMKNSAFIVEGVRLTEEALRSGWKPQFILYSDALSPRGLEIIAEYRHQEIDIEQISQSLMDSLGDTETSQGIIAILPMKSQPFPPQWDFVIVADGVRDPGNLGTLLRTAVAAGAQAVFLTPGSVDAYSPKVVRAGMGAHFRLPIFQTTHTDLKNLCQFRSGGPAKIFIAESSGGHSCWEMDLRQPLALVIGGEAEGASKLMREAADGMIHIPMPGESESLNAAIAAAILIFEVVRQRKS